MSGRGCITRHKLMQFSLQGGCCSGACGRERARDGCHHGVADRSGGANNARCHCHCHCCCACGRGPAAHLHGTPKLGKSSPKG